MCNRDVKPDMRINGLYIDREYYCVWTKDRTVDEILNTTDHEKVHAIIDKDYEHFCGGVK